MARCAWPSIALESFFLCFCRVAKTGNAMVHVRLVVSHPPFKVVWSRGCGDQLQAALHRIRGEGDTIRKLVRSRSCFISHQVLRYELATAGASEKIQRCRIQEFAKT